MHAARKGPLRQFFGGLFAAVDFTRRLVVNAIFLLIVLIFAIAIFSGGAGPLEQKTTLVIDPQGAIVEQYTAEPLDRALGESLGDPVRETRLRDIVQALEAAAKDKHISQVLMCLSFAASAASARRPRANSPRRCASSASPAPRC